MKEEMKENNGMNPDQIIENIGGCGRYQIRMSVIVHLIKTIVCFGFSNLIISTKTPSWYCIEGNVTNSFISCTNLVNKSDLTCRKEECNGWMNKTKCENIVFDSDLKTLSSEFNLICDIDYIPSTISSIQITGVLVGNVISGQLADLFGRKPPFFASILIILVTHVTGYFSTTWQMFAVSTFFAGLGGGFFLTTQYCLLSEFTVAKWRAWVVGFPSWPIEGCLFALCAWLLHDWRNFQLLTAVMAVPCLFTWWIIPESFRWYIAHDKPEKAKVIINNIAKYNRQHEFNSDEVLQKEGKTEDKKYTFLHLFKSGFLVRVTMLLMLNWLALGVVSYGIAFGIQTLSGNIYLNLFLFSITGIPTKGIAIWLQNKFGRRVSALICFIVVAVGGLTVGVVQTLDLPNKDELTNIFALIANAGISTAWGPVQTMTIELYPTVVRNIGFGTLSLAGRIGAIVGPQLVYLNTYFRGLLFYVCGGIAVLCVIGTIFLPETKDSDLNDKIKTDTQTTP
ncbi:organic cation transporter protein-like [Mercenaria mercenaria]|uniref:organic cation transporter protein-like n=1 Tax=Mercenaria mercenaria TaxID=6596 RepID=UPI00234E63AF|nr:organic cation transporter protein-like [Mercenaria mercenaria]XP_045211660.2 organic cation transporter protein-like [Mercenaria mercenaria]